MPEVREHPISRSWVIISTVRAALASEGARVEHGTVMAAAGRALAAFNAA